MLPDADIQRITEKVSEYFGVTDRLLIASAVRLLDDGYADTEILNILKPAFRAGLNEGHESGYAEGINGAE